MSGKPRTFIIAVVLALATLALASCSGGNLSVTDTSGAIEIKAENNATATATAAFQVSAEYGNVEFDPEIDAGTITVTFADAKTQDTCGTYTFDSSTRTHGVYEFDSGDYSVSIEAKGATGTLEILEVEILDGPGTAGS